MSQLQFSERAYHRIRKTERTISELTWRELVHFSHLAQALQY